MPWLVGFVRLVMVWLVDNSEDGIKMEYNITTGALPDATAFTPDCMTILTANEGEAGMDSEGNFINPEGSVTVVDLEALQKGEEGVKTLGFKFVNEETEKYLKDGVRWVWKGQALESGQDEQTMSRDLEPEQVVVTAVSREIVLFRVCDWGVSHNHVDCIL